MDDVIAKTDKTEIAKVDQVDSVSHMLYLVSTWHTAMTHIFPPELVLAICWEESRWQNIPQFGGGPAVGAVSGDRGFDSKANRDMLEGKKIYNAICPKDPGDLKKRMKEERFVKLQKRRSQTEARISIFKNGFLGTPLLSQGYGNQQREVAWSVLAHNLWVIARLPRGQAKALAKAS